jgi:RNA polymerase sigma-70 factor (ECF subfamily)
MSRYQCGDGDAAAKLVRRLSPLLWRYFETPYIDRSEIEDLLQNCWMRIHRSRHTYRPADPLLPWIFAIARHTKLDAYRQRRRRESREHLVSEPPEYRQPSAEPVEMELPDVPALLERLPESQREVILMLKISGMTIAEVARATSSTVGAVKQKAHRAYIKLRDMLEKDGWKR